MRQLWSQVGELEKWALGALLGVLGGLALALLWLTLTV